MNLAREFTQERLATTLLLSFVELFGLEPLAGDDEQRWLPATVLMELQHAAGGSILPQNFDKLMAAAEILGTDHMECSTPDFIRICNVLSDSPTDGSFDPAEAHEVGWAILEAGVILSRRQQFSPEIQGYIEQALRNAGLTLMISPFDIAVQDPQFAWSGSERATDDPELFEMAQAVEDEHSQQIKTYIQQRFSRLLQEVGQLPLSNAQANWRSELLQDLKRLLTHEDPAPQSQMA